MGGGGGGGGAHERLQHLIPSTAGARVYGGWGYPPPGNFEKNRLSWTAFRAFEDSLLGNKAG